MWWSWVLASLRCFCIEIWEKFKSPVIHHEEDACDGLGFLLRIRSWLDSWRPLCSTIVFFIHLSQTSPPKYICPNCRIYLSQSQKVFAQIVKCICQNGKHKKLARQLAPSVLHHRRRPPFHSPVPNITINIYLSNLKNIFVPMSKSICLSKWQSNFSFLLSSPTLEITNNMKSPQNYHTTQWMSSLEHLVLKRQLLHLTAVVDFLLSKPIIVEGKSCRVRIDCWNKCQSSLGK